MSSNKKHLVLIDLFNHCQENHNYIFHNDLVKEFCKKHKFGNPFDVTKIDNIDKMPLEIQKQGYGVIHLGNGNHSFIKSDGLMHFFEEIQQEFQWEYRKSILNSYNTSESNILSVANNQRILHHFLFEEDNEFANIDIAGRPKTYFPHRTKTSFDCKIGENNFSLQNIQIEIDLTIEYKGIVGIFEAKNLDFHKISKSGFAVYQIYMPFRYYHEARKITSNIKEIYAVYLVRTKIKDQDIISLWQYTFDDYTDMKSIKFIKSARNNLIKSEL
jgi:hypothetical protein